MPVLPPSLAFMLEAALLGLMTLCTLLLWRWRWRDYILPYSRIRLDKSCSGTTGASLPKISIVIPAHDQAEALERNLPLLLEQEYDDFEVIVVDEASTDETAEVLKRMGKKYERLRQSFVPKTARYVGRKKLAITIGIRAARSEWCLLTEADCQPVGQQWLASMASHLKPGTDFVAGYATYMNDGSHTARRAIYERLRYQLRCFRSAINGSAVGADGCNLCLRKEWFLNKQGFAKSLTVPFGEDTLLVNALAQRANTALELRNEAMIRQELPPRSVLRCERIHHQETLRHLNRRGRMFRWRESGASWCTCGLVIFTGCYLTLRVVSFFTGESYEMHFLYLDIPALLLLLTGLALPVFLLRRSTNCMGERPFGFTLYHYALVQPWRNLFAKIRCRRARKEFVRDLG